jgi:transposase
MIDVHTFYKIKGLYHDGHLRVGQIAEQLHLDVETISKWIQRDTYRRRTGSRRSSKLDAYKASVINLLQNRALSSTKILKILRTQGYTGGISILADFIRTKAPPLPISRREFLAYSWMHMAMQNAISSEEMYVDLKREFEPELVGSLLREIKLGPLRNRNKALAVLARKKGFSAEIVSKFLSVDKDTVFKWLKTFEERGAGQLVAKRSSGAKKADQKKYKEAVFSILHAPPSSYGVNCTSWRIKDITTILRQSGLQLCTEGVSKIIRDAGYRFRKAKKVLTSNDLNYREKLAAITAILSALRSDEKFFMLDEFGPFSIKMHGGRSLMKDGELKSVPQWQRSKGSLILTAALELSTNQVTHFYSKKKDTGEMIKLIEILLDEYSDESCIYLSWDAASWHASKRLFARVDEINDPNYRKQHRVPLVKLAPLPTRAQFLNVIESVFSGMARAIIHNSDYASVNEAIRAIDLYFIERNRYFRENPRRAGRKIWGRERVPANFAEANNCKDARW